MTDDELDIYHPALIAGQLRFGGDAARAGAFAAGAQWAAGFRRQGPVTEDAGRAAFLAFMGMDEADFAEMTPTYRAGSIAQGIAALEASRKVTP